MRFWSLVIFLELIGVAVSDPLPKPKKYYGLILNAGSTGTRLNVFEIQVENDDASAPRPKINLPVKFLNHTECNVVFNENLVLDEAKQAINDCINGELSLIQKCEGDNFIWMKFVGTEGLRSLKVSNKAKFTELMHGVEEIIKSKQTINSEFIEIIEISSETEFDYISTIYVQGTTNVDEMGVINLGDSSLGVAFPKSADSEFPSVFKLTTINLFDTDYTYAAINFKCGGVESIKSKYLIGLIRGAADSYEPITSPCHPNGFTQKIKTAELTNSCSSVLLQGQCLPPKINIIGEYNSEECSKKLFEAFCSDDDATNNGKCIIEIDPEDKLSVSSKIKLNLMGSWTYFSVEMETHNYKELITKMDQMFETNDCFLNDVEHCFSSKYLTFITSFFVKTSDEAEVNENKVDWSLGKMLAETKTLFAFTSHTVIIAIATVSILVVIIVVALCVVLWKSIEKKVRSNKKWNSMN